MTHQALVSIGSLAVYCVILFLIAVGTTLPTYHRWGLPFPYKGPFKRLLGQATDDKRCRDGKHDDRWKLDWGSVMFMWAVLIRNLWVMYLISTAPPNHHIDVILSGLYLVDAITGVIFYFYIRQESRRRKDIQ